jgi:hypothetical protein
MIRGEYANGGGQFHTNMDQFKKIFNCPMIGSFNIKTAISIMDFPHSIYLPDKFNHRNATGGIWFWLVKLNREYYGWAIRWGGSKQKGTTWEIISKEPFPDSLKGDIEIEVMERWSDERIKEWDRATYQFQTFPWSSQPRADSKFVWDMIKDRGLWPGATVLDIGCNFGFHSQMAADAGAIVTGYDKNDKVLIQSRLINDHIKMNDCRFRDNFPVGIYDYIFYFSVHHQGDPFYETLSRKIHQLKGMARKKVFAEFIVPALKGPITEANIDALIGNHGILKYKHKVRANRKIYEIKGEARP